MKGLDSLDKLAVTVVAEDSVLYESPYWGQHGISLMGEAEKNGFSRNYLIDVAQNPQALLHNMDLLSIDPARIDGIILTHCHYDHTLGLAEILKRIGKRDLPVIAHPDIFKLNFIVAPFLRHVGVMGGDSREKIAENGGTLYLTADPLQLMPGLTTTGEVRRQTDFEEVGIPLRTIDGENRVVEDRMRDDISVIAGVGPDQVVILTGCSHAGIVNIAKQAAALSGRKKIASIIGGLHLVEAPMDRIRKTAAALAEMDIAQISAGHCTGFEAQAELRSVFGSRFTPLHTGMRFVF